MELDLTPHDKNALGERYRHELKYELNAIQLELLKSRLPVVMRPDPHVDKTGKYLVRSLYFDDYDDRCFQENEDGTDPREKFRLRIYNGSTSRISLELKRKKAGMTHKRSCMVSEAQTLRLMEGKRPVWEDDMDPLLKKLYLLMEASCLRPKMIVEYDRIPFVCRDGNTRVTLDLNVRASAETGSFLDERTRCRPVLPVGTQLLEVKFDEFLPDYIYRSIQMKGLQHTTFSKYYLCRKFGGIT